MPVGRRTSAVFKFSMSRVRDVPFLFCLSVCLMRRFFGIRSVADYDMPVPLNNDHTSPVTGTLRDDSR